VKLAARGSGRWEQSAGVRSKFGLTLPEILEGAQLLESKDLLKNLSLLHFHMGSQITNIRFIKGAITEASRIYVELVRMGASMEVLDVGGGLGIDYDGSQTNFESSMNYTLQEYANDVVYRIKSVCDEAKIPCPKIYSESGRALVSYNSVLIFDVLGKTSFQYEEQSFKVPGDAPKPLQTLKEIWDDANKKNFVENYHDAVQSREECANLFDLGYMSLRARAQADSIFWSICTRTLQFVQESQYAPDELEGLEELLSDIYFCNFSLFQSMPDSWAIRQLFPVMPIHRLREEPARRGVLADITCDSDGKIDQFVDLRDVKKTLPLHDFKKGDSYYIGVFLIGAYQEILGDLHNLLGDTHAVHVSFDDEGEIAIGNVVKGDTVSEVLSYVQYDPEFLTDAMRETAERARRKKKLTLAESALFMRYYEEGMSGYTYLEKR